MLFTYANGVLTLHCRRCFARRTDDPRIAPELRNYCRVRRNTSWKAMCFVVHTTADRRDWLINNPFGFKRKQPVNLLARLGRT